MKSFFGENFAKDAKVEGFSIRQYAVKVEQDSLQHGPGGFLMPDFLGLAGDYTTVVESAAQASMVSWGMLQESDTETWSSLPRRPHDGGAEVLAADSSCCYAAFLISP
jgi:hypothetical protein